MSTEGNPEDLIVPAVQFAAEKHAHQRRKNATQEPYINHTIGVMHLLWESGVHDPAILSAAVLHDVVEDTDVSLDEIRERFGAEVASVVAEVSSDKTLTTREQKKQQLEHAPRLSFAASVVKQADRLHNLSMLKDGPPAKWTREYLLAYLAHSLLLADRLSGLPALSERIRACVSKYAPEPIEHPEKYWE